MTETAATGDAKRTAKLRCRAHGEFAAWLAASGGSLLITTYTSGKLVLVSCRDERLQFRSVAFPRPMGMAFDGKQLAIAIQKRILLYDRGRSSRTFRQKTVFDTGRLDSHDLAFGKRGLFLVNTKFNCIARATTRKHFLHCWRPDFISDLVGQDHCHLNGLGMLDGRPAMATAFSETDTPRGWRTDNRFSSGVLIDITQNEVVARGLCMPHSPRFHRDGWWLCNSGLGTLCRLDTRSGSVEEVCQLPGFTRGLCFVDDHALVGLSRIRAKHVLDTRLLREQANRSRAGVALVSLTSDKQVGGLEFVSGGREVYEVLFLPGIKRPNVPPFDAVVQSTRT